MNTRVLEYTVKREINYQEIENEICAFKDTLYIGERVISTKEGIAKKNEILKIKEEKEVKCLKLCLCKKEILKYQRTDTKLFQDEDTYKKVVIRNPYTYIEKNGTKDTLILNVSFYDHHLYDINGNKLPKAIYFSYIEGNVDNKTYDLNEILNILNARKDIKFLSDGIRKIPSYNADSRRNKYIEFLWMPNNEDWEKVKNLDDTYNLRQFIKSEILGFKELPDAHDYDYDYDDEDED